MIAWSRTCGRVCIAGTFVACLTALGCLATGCTTAGVVTQTAPTINPANTNDTGDTAAVPTSAPASAAVIDPTPIPTAAPTSAPPALSSPTATATSEPTGTPEPTATATSEPTATATAEPTGTPEPTPTATSEPTATPTPTRIDRAAARTERSEAACPAEVTDHRITCYSMAVPADIDAPDVGNVQLAVAYVDNGDPLGIGPVVYLQGGPGIGALDYANSFAGIDHDVVLIDQRGTGHSRPKLDCPEVDAHWVGSRTADPEAAIEDADLIQNYKDCAIRLWAEGIDLNLFNTDAAAADVELIRRSFTDEPWSVWGVSYGTRWAQTVMRDYPEGVRAAVLDSVLPFEVDFFAAIPTNALRAIDELDSACDVTRCEDDHGDFTTELTDLIAKLDAEPQQLQVTRPVSGETFPHRVTGAEVIDIVFGQLYSTNRLVALPRQVSRADAGGLKELLWGSTSRIDPEVRDLALGVYYSTWCREELPFHNAAAARAAIERGVARFGPGFDDAFSSSEVGQVCVAFAVDPAPPVTDQPLNSSIPTMIFAGRFDPITPPQWSLQVAQRLPNAYYVEMADHGHGMTTACPGSIHVAFLVDPTSEPDLSCTGAVAGPTFD